ncbi:MAG: hypothetical protein ACI835_004785 [Planctomycetota bacterium]|jgi:hypothetical protein
MFFTTLSLAAAIAGLLPIAMPSVATSAVAPATTAADLEWFDGPFTNAIGMARQDDANVVIYFWSDNSESCGKMYTDTIQNQRSKDVLKKNVLVSANYNTDVGAKLFKRFNVTVLPTIMIVTGEGNPEDAIVGIIDVDGFLGEFERIGRHEGTVSGLRAVAAAAKAGSDDAIEANWKLAGKLSDLGQSEGHDKILVTIRESDPKAKTVIGARAHLWKLRDDINEGCSGKDAECSCDADAAEGKEGECESCDAFVKADLSPLYVFAKKLKADESRFETWQTIGNMEVRKQDVESAVKAFKAANKACPKDQQIGFAKGVANWIINSNKEEQHSTKVKKFALEMAESAVEKARLLDPMTEAYQGAYGETEPRYIQAESMFVLAFAYDLNGDSKKAKKMAAKILELTESDDYKETLAPIL